MQVGNLSDLEQLAGLITPAAAWRWMRNRYQNGRLACPKCKRDIAGNKALAAWVELRRVYCQRCGAIFLATVGTPIHSTGWRPHEFAALVILAGAGHPPARIAAVIGKSVGAVRDMLGRAALVGQTID